MADVTSNRRDHKGGVTIPIIILITDMTPKWAGSIQIPEPTGYIMGINTSAMVLLSEYHAKVSQEH